MNDIASRFSFVLTNEAVGDLNSAFEQFQQRLQNERVADSEKQEKSEVAGRLLEMRFTADIVRKLSQGAGMKTEDTTMYRVMAEIALSRAILKIGTKKLGPPPPEVEPTLKAMLDMERLERILERAYEAASWDDLLATP